jgi:hypothetical protein
MKKIILICFLFLPNISANSQTLHLILVSDYADPTFGKISLQNEEKITTMFRTVADTLHYGYKILYLNTMNKRFNRANVVSGINSINTNPEDIIIFYYNGLGVYPNGSNSIFPSFKLADTDNNPLSMDAVTNQLRNKRGRLMMVISDTRDTQNTFTEIPPGFTVGEDLKKIIVRKLFLETSGLYKIASSKKKKPSYPYFTQAFTKNFTYLLQEDDSNEIPPMSLNFLLERTQNSLNSMVSESTIKIPQQIETTFEKFNRPVKNYPSSTFDIPSPALLKSQLELLANNTLDSIRVKTIQSVRNLFTPNAMLEVRVENANSQNNSIAKMTIEDYIKQTEKYDKTKKRTIEFFVFDFKRTEDFKKFSSLSFVEK